MSSSYDYDVAVVGGGPGGYSAAIRAAQFGYKTIIIEKRTATDSHDGRMGGTCLNVGCIPSKALLHSGHTYYSANQKNAVGLPRLDMKPLLGDIYTHQDATVSKLVGGIRSRLVAEKVEILIGTAYIASDHEIRVTSPAQSVQTIQAEHIILATGAQPRNLPHMPCDGQVIVHSDQAIQLSEVPSKLAVIGAGIIGIEMAVAWAQLGSQVTMLEQATHFLPMLDLDISRLYKKYIESFGIKIHLGVRIDEHRQHMSGVDLQWTLATQEQAKDQFDSVLVAVGREPILKSCLDESLHDICDANGYAQVNESFQTSINSIYAIGDIVPGPQLAHRAIHQGVQVVENIVGVASASEPYFPAVIYTHLEMSWFGLTEAQAQEQGIDVQAKRISMMANGRHLASHGEKFGTIKLVVDRHDIIIGAQVLGTNSGDWIHILVAIASMKGGLEDIINMSFAHPTYAEALHDLASSMRGKGIHIANQIS